MSNILNEAKLFFSIIPDDEVSAKKSDVFDVTELSIFLSSKANPFLEKRFITFNIS